jgi:hypothetical protein
VKTQATAAVKRLLGPGLTVQARGLARGLPLPRWGNFRRVSPFSSRFGFERGTPIDRYYMNTFLDQHAMDIRGDVLEIQSADTVRRFGHGLGRVDTLDIDPAFAPTYCCDLAASGGVVPDASYDCFVLPSTLPFLKDLDGALHHAYRVLKPGGVILAPTPALGQIDTDAIDYWRFTADGWREVGRRVWPECDVQVTSYGNCLAATAAVMGLACEELTPAELDVADPRFPVVVGIRCLKP